MSEVNGGTGSAGFAVSDDVFRLGDGVDGLGILAGAAKDELEKDKSKSQPGTRNAKDQKQDSPFR